MLYLPAVENALVDIAQYDMQVLLLFPLRFSLNPESSLYYKYFYNIVYSSLKQMFILAKCMFYIGLYVGKI